MSEESDFAMNYLNMTDSAATTDLDRRILARIRATYSRLAQERFLSAAVRA
jgi:glucokinase